MPGKTPRPSVNEERLRKLPGYVCMICGERENLSAVPVTLGIGDHPWWQCKIGYGCSLTEPDAAGRL